MSWLLRSVLLGILVFFALQCAFGQTQDSTAGGTAPTTGGSLQVGGGVSAPRAVYAPDPEYSEEARKKKFQGKCVLWLIVPPDGRPRDIKVAGEPLGLGLDEKAIEAVSQWRFEPALKDGKPVAVKIKVEVNFRLPASKQQK